MNNTLQDFVRAELKTKLVQCTEKQQILFKRMYSHENLNASIEDIVNGMDADKLDWAMQQVERTLKKGYQVG